MTQKVQVIVFSVDGSQLKILLFKRAGRDLWQPITGGVEEGETIEIAAGREATEEAEIRAPSRVIPNIYSFTFENPPGHRRAGTVVEHVFGYEVAPGFLPTLSEEHDGAKWVSAEEALRLLPENDQKVALQKLIKILGK